MLLAGAISWIISSFSCTGLSVLSGCYSWMGFYPVWVGLTIIFFFQFFLVATDQYRSMKGLVKHRDILFQFFLVATDYHRTTMITVPTGTNIFQFFLVATEVIGFRCCLNIFMVYRGCLSQPRPSSSRNPGFGWYRSPIHYSKSRTMYKDLMKCSVVATHWNYGLEYSDDLDYPSIL